MSAVARFSMTCPAELLPHIDAVARREQRTRSAQMVWAFIQLYGDGQQVDARDGDTGSEQGDTHDNQTAREGAA